MGDSHEKIIKPRNQLREKRIEIYRIERAERQKSIIILDLPLQWKHLTTIRATWKINNSTFNFNWTPYISTTYTNTSLKIKMTPCPSFSSIPHEIRKKPHANQNLQTIFDFHYRNLPCFVVSFYYFDFYLRFICFVLMENYSKSPIHTLIHSFKQ